MSTVRTIVLYKIIITNTNMLPMKQILKSLHLSFRLYLRLSVRCFYRFLVYIDAGTADTAATLTFKTNTAGTGTWRVKLLSIKIIILLSNVS